MAEQVGGEQVGGEQVGGERVDATVLATMMESVAQGVGLQGRLGIVVTEASPQRVVGTMPVEGNTQPFGLLHGGASCVLAESLGSIGATLHAMQSFGGYALGVELSASHHRAVTSGLVTGVATPIHLGGRIATYEIVMTGAEGERICTVRLTCLLRRG